MAQHLLDDLRWRQRYITQLGCIKGALEYLGKNVSYPWLYGGTGYAFVLNIQKTLDPSGPSCWDTRPVFSLAPNLGFILNGFSFEKAEVGDTFPDKQRQAWDFVRAKLDQGLPCYGWEVYPYIPDYYIINGYEDGERDAGATAGYFYSGWMAGGPRDWRTLGESDVQVLQVYSVEPGETEDTKKVVKDALTTVIDHSSTPSGWFDHPDYATGPAGFDLWADALEKSTAVRDGHCYNAATWLECREMAVEFLQEARHQLPGCCDAAFDESVTHFAFVRDSLRAVLALHPFHPETWDPVTKLQCTEAAILLRQAGAVERQGLANLQKIVAVL